MKAFSQDHQRAAKRHPPPSPRSAPALEEARWDDVRVFLAAYRYGTLGAAARTLALDTSTMSRRLSAFEEALGARLFDRSREGLLPTRAAEVVLAAAEAMEAAHARLSRDASDLEATAEGTVRLSVAPAMADRFLAPLLPALHRQHPGIRVELDGSVRAVDLTRHEADLALRSVAPVGAELVVTKLGTGRWLAVGAAARVKELGRLRRWDDAAWIGWDRDLASFAPARWLAKHVNNARVVLRTSLFSAQLIAAEAGLGLLLVPEPYLRGEALAPVRYAPALAASVAEWPTDSLWLAGHRAMREVPRVAAVWKFLAEELRRAMAPRRG
jgi:DNA-binding transcriptional LysR family regulator